MKRGRDTHDKQVIAAFRSNGGVPQSGLDLLLLHHVGARSGRKRVTPLGYWPVSDTSIAVLASNRGVANPDAKAEIGTGTFLARARIAGAGERSKLLARIVDQTPSVSIAMDRTSREIPVVILDLRAPDVRPAAP
jgi:deazaflavin-dependent oxidoreductase (nitroreductase family)